MITNIYLHSRQIQELAQTAREELRKKAVNDFPYPLALSFNNFFKACNEKDKTAALVIFVNDLTTSIFQFISLVLVSEYIEIKTPRCFNLYQTIENMTYRPGPGKWLAFFRAYYNYKKQNGDTLNNFPELLEFIDRNEIRKHLSCLTIEENHGESPDKKLGLLEMMVNFRNSFAHSRGYDDKSLDDIYSSISNVVDLLCLELLFIRKYHLYLCPADEKQNIRLAGTSLPQPIMTLSLGQHLEITREKYSLRLFPLIINDLKGKKNQQDIFLMESIDNKKVFYASNRLVIEKLTDKDDLASLVVNTLKSIYIEPELFSADKIEWNSFRKRTIDHSSKTVSEYTLNGKYDENVYVLPESQNELMCSFFKSDRKVLYLRGDQGSGKSALCAYLADKSIKRNKPNEATILIDARLLDELGDNAFVIDQYIMQQLGIKGNFVHMLERFDKKNPKQKITIIIDNLNEYYLKGKDQIHLMDKLFVLLDRIKSFAGVQIIAVARKEYFERSILYYYNSFKDRAIEAITYMPYQKNDGTVCITIPLPALTNDELARIWYNYSTQYTGHSPKSAWENLSLEIKNHCSKPLIMLFLLNYYDNKHIPEKLSINDINKKYVSDILADKPQRNTLFYLLKLMNNFKKPYVLSKDLEKTQNFTVPGKKMKHEYGLTYSNEAYKRLIDKKLIKEEMVMADKLLGKKISVNNEMTLNLIKQEYQRYSKRQNIKGFAIINAFTIGLALLLGAILLRDIEITQSIETLSIYLKSIADQYSFSNETYSALYEIAQNNHMYKLVRFYSIIPPLILALSFFIPSAVLVSGLVFSTKTLLRKYQDQRFDVFEIFIFSEILKALNKKILLFVLYSLTVYFLCFITCAHLGYIAISFKTMLIFLFIWFLTIFSYRGVLYYREFVKNKRCAQFFTTFAYTYAKKLFLPFLINIILYFSALYFFPNIINFAADQTNQYYSGKFMQNISVLKQVASEDEVDDLISLYNDHHFRNQKAELFFYNISMGLSEGNVNLLGSQNMMDKSYDWNSVEKLGRAFRSAFTDYFFYLFFILFLSIIGLFLSFETAKWFAKKNRAEIKISV